MPKAEFARRMGIQRQNVKALFKSKDLRVIQKAADVMGVPWIFLVGNTEEPDADQIPTITYEEYLDFARQYPEEYEITVDASSDRLFEIAPEDIPTGNSVEDRRASLTYLSTLAVLQLDTIMRDAVYVGQKAARSVTKNQKQFSKMIQLRHTLPGIGHVRLMVRVKKQDNSKVQYCITSIDAMLETKNKAVSN